MTYNLTNINTPMDLIITANTLADGKFGIVISLVVFIISLIYFATSERPFGYAFASAAYLSTIFAILLLVIGIVPDWYVYIMIFLTIGGLAYTIFNK